MHWIDRVVQGILEYWGEKSTINCNSGLSVSGLQHVGRLRGEITIANVIKEKLRDLGHNSRHTLILYTQDEWKGKESQLKVFQNPEEAKQYRGWRLIDVPDPYGCHDGWVQHYWMDFGDYLDEFSIDVKIITTTEIYRQESMKKIIKSIMEKRKRAREIINKYRGRKPYPEDWIPFEALCPDCRRIGAKVVSIDLDRWMAEYVCSCGSHGWSNMEFGKLNWRLEWTALWMVLDVGFEPFGKDHATPGGSRDSCVDLAENLLQFKPPYGLPYEWVGLSENGKDLGDMGSSDFKGFTPKDWLRYAEPEPLRYIYLYNDPMRRITLGLKQIPQYVNNYDRAERIYYGIEEVASKEEETRIKRSYELARLTPPPNKMPFQLPYLHAVLLAQVLPEENRVEEAVERLKKCGLLKEIDDESLKHIEIRLEKAGRWAEEQAPESYKIRILKEINQKILDSLSLWQKNMLKRVAEALKAIGWNENEIKDSMSNIGKAYCKTKEQQREFFEAMYQVILGRKYGPRIAPLLSILNRDWVIRRFEEASTK